MHSLSRELQHMLFTRRKAEIEIISRAIIPWTDGSQDAQDGEEDEDGKGEKAQQVRHPLLDYIREKIAVSIERAQMQV